MLKNNKWLLTHILSYMEVVQPGVSSFTFTPATSVVGTTYYLRGTGAYSLVIS